MIAEINKDLIKKQLPTIGTLTSKDKRTKLDFERKGDNYICNFYNAIEIGYQDSITQISFIYSKSEVMNLEHFIDYIINEQFLEI